MRLVPALAAAVLGLAALGSAAPALAAPPPNDAFAAAQQLPSAAPLNVAATTAGATTETGEPQTPGYGGTIWFAWTAPRKSRFRIANCSTTANTWLGVYTGSSLSTLKEVYPAYYRNHDDQAQQKCAPGEAYGSPYLIEATAGTTYYIQVQEGYSFDPGGPLQLTIEDRPGLLDVGITLKQSRKSVRSGGTVTYTVTVTTRGDLPVERFEVNFVTAARGRQKAAANVRYISIATSRGERCARQTFYGDEGSSSRDRGAKCAITRLEPGQTTVVTAKVKLRQSISHRAFVTSTSPDDQRKNDESTVRTTVRR